MVGIYFAIFGCPRRNMIDVKEMWQYLWSWFQNGGPMLRCERDSKIMAVFRQNSDSVRNL